MYTFVENELLPWIKQCNVAVDCIWLGAYSCYIIVATHVFGHMLNIFCAFVFMW